MLACQAQSYLVYPDLHDLPSSGIESDTVEENGFV